MFKRIIFIIICFMLVSCHQITSDMREGLTFNYKDVGYDEVKDEKHSGYKVVIDTLDNEVIFKTIIEYHPHATFLGGYYKEKNTLFLCYENTSKSKTNCKCIPTNFLLTYKINKEYLNYKYVKTKVIY